MVTSTLLAARLSCGVRRSPNVAVTRGLARVVVTGLGCVSPLAGDAETTFSRIIAGETGVDRIKDAEEYEKLGIPSLVAAQVECGSESGQFDWKAYVDRHTNRKVPLNIQFATAAAKQAFAMAGLEPSNEAAYERGVAFGCGISGLQDILEADGTLHTRGYRRVSPYLIPNALVNMSAGLISIQHNLKGPNHAASTACATGAHAIGDAYRMIKHGDARVMVAGGTDACVLPVIVAGFCRAKALATSFNDNPKSASRPFDAGRAGFVIGEGAAAVLLEEYEHAKARGATILAEVCGYGMSGDAFHITAPSDDGAGARSCMIKALNEARLSPDDIDYVNAHATSTPLGDEIEARAIARVFEPRINGPVAVSSTKGATGHLLGAAGAIEAVISILALRHGKLPPTLNLEDSSQCEASGIELVSKAQDRELRAVMTNSFGFGGTNTSLCFVRPDDS